MRVAAAEAMRAGAASSRSVATVPPTEAAATGGDSPLERARDGVIRCNLCPRLRSYCQDIGRAKKRAHRDDVYWARPVPGFGDPAARVLVVGLAPAAHGANRTGRVFTGDGSGDFLMRALHSAGFANIPTAKQVGDGLALRDAYILSVVRCAPPDNKPEPAEVVRCRVHLRAELAALARVRVVVALGKIAWDGYLAYLRDEWRAAGGPGPWPAGRKPVFGHGAVFPMDSGLPTLIGSYHPSRQNTNTGKLTPPMLDAVFARARSLLDDSREKHHP